MKPLVFIFFVELVLDSVFAFVSFHRDHPSGNRHSGKGHGGPRIALTVDSVPHACLHSDIPGFSLTKCLAASAEEHPDNFAAIVEAHLGKLSQHLNINAILADKTIRNRIDQPTARKFLSDQHMFDNKIVKAVLDNKGLLDKVDTDAVLEVLDDSNVGARIDTPKADNGLLDPIAIAFENAKNDSAIKEAWDNGDYGTLTTKYLKYLRPAFTEIGCVNDLIIMILGDQADAFDFPNSITTGVCIKADRESRQIMYDIMYYLVPLPTKYIRKYIPYVLFVPVGLYCFIAITSIVCMWVCCWPCVGGSTSRSLEAQDDFVSKGPRPNSKPKDANRNEPKTKDAAKEPSTGSKKRKDKERKYKD